MKKWLLSILLAFCMVLVLLPRTAQAADIAYPVTGGNIYFDVTTGTITGCDYAVTEANIPSEIYGVPVVTIGNEAFRGCGNLTSVTIPGSVTSIGTSAFYQCYGLTGVNIPSGVTAIENNLYSE